MTWVLDMRQALAELKAEAKRRGCSYISISYGSPDSDCWNVYASARVGKGQGASAPKLLDAFDEAVRRALWEQNQSRLIEHKETSHDNQ